MTTLLSTWTFGLALVALGVFVRYKLFSFPDVATDGSFTLGAVVAAAALSSGVDPSWRHSPRWLPGAPQAARRRSSAPFSASSDSSPESW
jgi:hypothetical protein